MDYLERYLDKKVNIYGLDTYIIAPEKYEKFLKDEVVFQKLPFSKSFIDGYVSIAKEVKDIRLYLAICHNTHIPRPFVGPVHCLKIEGKWYHVFYNSYWLCRDCNHENGPVVRPLIEADGCYYAGLDRTKIRFPDIFRHHCCEKCGHLLQGHLMKL